MMTCALAECAAWEVTPADQTAYWDQVPDQVKLTLHYYNVPCSVEPESEFNPLRIIRTLYQPGDFVVIKACFWQWSRITGPTGCLVWAFACRWLQCLRHGLMLLAGPQAAVPPAHSGVSSGNIAC